MPRLDHSVSWPP